MEIIEMLKALIITVFALSSSQVIAANRPLTSTEQTLVEESVRAQALDPESAKFRHNTFDTTADQYCGLVNMKNKMGGYNGYRVFQLRIDKTGGVIKAVTKTSIVETDNRDAGTKGLIGMLITSSCASRGYKVEY